jgi:hypothetical protein
MDHTHLDFKVKPQSDDGGHARDESPGAILFGRTESGRLLVPCRGEHVAKPWVNRIGQTAGVQERAGYEP